MKLAPEKNPSGDPQSEIFMKQMLKMKRFHNRHFLWNEKELLCTQKLNPTFPSFKEKVRSCWCWLRISPHIILSVPFSESWGFLGCLTVTTLPSSAGDAALAPHTSGPENQNMNRSNIVTNSIKTFKMVHITKKKS